MENMRGTRILGEGQEDLERDREKRRRIGKIGEKQGLSARDKDNRKVIGKGK
jgi:hypothetical protein